MMPNLRIAFREEGLYWVAYVTKIDTMQDALVLGSIAMAAAADPKVRAAFMDVMKMAFMTISPVPVESWNKPVKARESERSGNA